MVTLGSIPAFWRHYHTSLNYRRVLFNNQADITQWRAQGYTQLHFGGEVFDMGDIMPAWADMFLNLFDGQFASVSFYKMSTGDILPYHQDTYKKYIEIYKITDPPRIKRTIIFLEDWKPGHMFEIFYKPITNWKAGDFVTWSYDTPHMAANLGMEARFTAQITYLDV